MKVSRSEQGLTLQLGKKEATLLGSLLQHYPCVPPGHFNLSRGEPLEKKDEIQELLEESLRDQREATRQNVQNLMLDPLRWRRHPKGVDLQLSPTDTEWLLQVLNEVRVGSWVHLGSPDDLDAVRNVAEDKLPYAWMMELAGYFQAALLETPEP